MLAGCSFGGNQNPLPPSGNYPDSSTPTGLDEFNGGLIADVVIYGRPCNLVTDDVAAAIQKWQGSQKGFVKVSYKGHALWAVDKAVVFKFCNNENP